MSIFNQARTEELRNELKNERNRYNELVPVEVRCMDSGFPIPDGFKWDPPADFDETKRRLEERINELKKELANDLKKELELIRKQKDDLIPLRVRYEHIVSLPAEFKWDPPADLQEIQDRLMDRMRKIDWELSELLPLPPLKSFIRVEGKDVYRKEKLEE